MLAKKDIYELKVNVFVVLKALMYADTCRRFFDLISEPITIVFINILESLMTY